MPWTQDQLNTLETAISTGNLRVKYQDKEVVYRSLDEMIRVRNLMSQSLNPTSIQIKAIKPIFSKGL